MAASLDEVMEQASRALAQMNYLSCEALCLSAMASAQAAGDWGYFARVLMPLQEARRQRRMLAAEGTIRLGSRHPLGDAAAMLARAPTGCVMLTRPHTPDDAAALVSLARQQRRYVEVLWADNAADATTWTIRSFVGATPVRCSVNAPPSEWLDRWIDPNSSTGPRPRALLLSRADASVSAKAAGAAPRAGQPRQRLDTPGTTPSDWFIDASERLGDAALEAARFASGDDMVRFRLLRACLDVVHDHELIHQLLADAARRLARHGQP